MNKKIFLYFFLFIFIFNSKISFGNTVFIDIDFVIKNSNIGKITLKKLETLNNQNIEKLKNKQSELKNLENELNNKKNIISSDEFNKELKELEAKFKNFNTEKEKMVNNFKSEQNKEISSVLKKINSVIQNYMNNNSIELVLDKKNIFVGKVSSDITEKILIEVNNKFRQNE
tara:strand:- start:676 stop:1191 length:516 start_codon:yes stop_codon:yes gene_type:complete